MAGYAAQLNTGQMEIDAALAKTMTMAFMGGFATISSLDPARMATWEERYQFAGRKERSKQQAAVLPLKQGKEHISLDRNSAAVRAADQDGQVTLRTLIAGICHSYNNLLMGIQGNAGLVRYRSNLPATVKQKLLRIEVNVQSGAFVTNFLLTYLGERRQAARKLRLRQLVDEVVRCVEKKRRSVAAKVLYEQLMWTARVKSPRLVAVASARLMQTLLDEIETILDNVAESLSQRADNRKSLKQMRLIVGRANRVTAKLKMYAGDVKPKMRNCDLATELRKIKRSVEESRPDLKVDLKLGGQTEAFTDPDLLAAALNEMAANAVEASPPDSCLTLEIGGQEEQEAHERFGRSSDVKFLVIGIRDYGHGMDRRRQLRAFDPFFSHHATDKSRGLGLAVASGIARSLGGFVHLQSENGKGTRISIYLPAACKAVECRVP